MVSFAPFCLNHANRCLFFSVFYLGSLHLYLRSWFLSLSLSLSSLLIQSVFVCVSIPLCVPHLNATFFLSEVPLYLHMLEKYGAFRGIRHRLFFEKNKIENKCLGSISGPHLPPIIWSKMWTTYWPYCGPLIDPTFLTPKNAQNWLKTDFLVFERNTATNTEKKQTKPR